MEWPLLILLGFGTGAYGVLVGAGGGFILGPLLLLFMDMEPEVVAGTVLASDVVSSVSGSYMYRRMQVVDYRSALLFAGAAIPGSVIGAFGVGQVTPTTFRVLFGALLLVLAAQIALRTLRRESTGRPRHVMAATVRSRHIRSAAGDEYRYEFNELFATSFNLVLGFISSFFGTGGGFLRTPILVSYFGFPVRVAAATSVFALSIYATVGAATHAALGHVEWFPVFALTGVGMVAGGQVGAWAAGKVRGAWVLRLLAVMILVLGVRLVLEGFLA